jgi:hypothetical protein
MEDIIKDLSPFLLAILYFALSALGGRKKKTKQHSGPRPPFNEGEANTPPRRKPLTFEDLLKEIEGYTTGSQDKENTQEREILPEYAEEENQAQARRFKDYEGNVGGAKKYSRLGDRVKLETSAKKLVVEDLEPEEIIAPSSIALDIKKALQSQEGARKAIIFSEILNRKYT